jgi:epoxyqueuosine reductase
VSFVIAPVIMRGMHKEQLAAQIKTWGTALGFQAVGIASVELPQAEQRLLEWLAAGRHGAMDYMAKHGTKRTRPAQLVPGTLRVISARLDYRPPQARDSWEVMRDPHNAFISRYALGRDYHILCCCNASMARGFFWARFIPT